MDPPRGLDIKRAVDSRWRSVQYAGSFCPGSKEANLLSSRVAVGTSHRVQVLT